MAITRYHPPLIPGTKEHMKMDASISGVYVTFREYDQKTKHLAMKLELLQEENDKLRAENLALRFPEET